MTLCNFTTDVVERLARDRSGEEALRAIASDGGKRRFTFEEVAHEASQAAAGLAAAGVQKGDVVMTLMGATPAWVFTLLGAWRSAPQRCHARSSFARRTSPFASRRQGRRSLWSRNAIGWSWR